MRKMLTTLTAALMMGSLSAQPQQNMQNVLSEYFNVKNGLVRGDAEYASATSAKLILAVTEWGQPEAQKAGFADVKEELLKQASIMANTGDIEKQRVALAEFSVKLWPIVKSSEPLGQTLYYDYCPMKRAFWVSEEATIKNPFYGNQMLSCGKVEEKTNDK